ncbi:hypothetical protein ITJ44_11875 [Clavibacter sp. VKM Ac-2873]|uniref:hypothetical protein n=1 Tax=Clavibacter sp. VKM Ac-2873 TaxID=2783813 RepID=UPI00188A1A6F|nr:hypothetical protein [Clavibacter sp. VKM Ac-2873]MBF4618769.1 hypothetical protein [Clavibacter sp. VKM Ac-2873]
MIVARRNARIGSAVVLTLTAAVGLSGCGSAVSTVDPSEARESVVTAVEATTAAVGGDWTLYRGPWPEVCEQPGGRDGARFVYILEREGADGPAPAADTRTVDELWQGRGIATQPYRSGSSAPLIGITGVGGPVDSIEFRAYRQGYTVSGASWCFDGDVGELRESG